MVEDLAKDDPYWRDATQETSRPSGHISDVGLGKFLSESHSECGDMQPPLRREVQTRETSQPLPRDRCKFSYLWRISKQYMPGQHALPRAGFGPALPAVGHLARQPRQVSPFGGARQEARVECLDLFSHLRCNRVAPETVLPQPRRSPRSSERAQPGNTSR